MTNDITIETPRLPFDRLGITTKHVRSVVVIRRPVWLLMVEQQSLHPYADPVWQIVETFWSEPEAQAAFDAISPGLRETSWYRVVEGFTWEQREVWYERQKAAL